MAQDVSVDAPVLTPGDTFEFVDSAGHYTVHDIGWEGDLFVSVVEYDDGTRFRDHYTPHLNLVRSQEEGSSEISYFEPDAMKYRFPMRVGLRWKGHYATTVRTASGTVTRSTTTDVDCEVQCLERIEVPAGAFETFRIECSVRESDQVYETLWRYWYSPEAGVSVLAESARHDLPDRVDRQVLIGFDRSEQTPFHALADGSDSTCDFELVSR